LHQFGVQRIGLSVQDVFEECSEIWDVVCIPFKGEGDETAVLRVRNRQAIEVLRQRGLEVPFEFEKLPQGYSIVITNAPIEIRQEGEGIYFRERNFVFLGITVANRHGYQFSLVHPVNDTNELVVAIFELQQALGSFFVNGDPGEHDEGKWNATTIGL